MAETTNDSTTDPKPQSKTDFVLSLPKDTPAAEVVAQANAIGMTLSPGQVHNIRSVAKASRKKKRAAKTAASTPKAAPGPKKTSATKKKTRATKKSSAATPATAKSVVGFGSKRAFVESLPRTTPASEVVAAAKKAGVELTTQYVYVIRSKPGSKGAAKGKPGRPNGSKNKTPAAASAPSLEKRRPGRPKGSVNKTAAAAAPALAAAAAPVKRRPGRPKKSAVATPVAAVGVNSAGKPDLENAVAALVIEYGRQRVQDVLTQVDGLVARLLGRA
ncbi:MAG: hypothetical protein ACHREM_03460 [Polyangiales bacterium]